MIKFCVSLVVSESKYKIYAKNSENATIQIWPHHKENTFKMSLYFIKT